MQRPIFFLLGGVFATTHYNSRIAKSHSATSTLREPATYQRCDITRLFKPWKKEIKDSSQSVCSQPDLGYLDSCRCHGKPWNAIIDDKFDECSDGCVGFKGSGLDSTIKLCSLYAAKYMRTFDREQNYIGFVFAAVRKNGEWFYNDKIFRTRTYKNGRKYKHASIKTGYVLMKRVDQFDTSNGFHRGLLEDFFGLSQDQMVQQGLFFIGWGFSYQARDTKTNEPLCDFKFKSSTFNSGALFGNEPEFDIEHGGRELQEKVGNFFRLGFNQMRARGTRLYTIDEILHTQRIYRCHGIDRFLPKCESKTTDFPFGLKTSNKK